MSCRRATSATIASGARLSSTIRSFSADVQRRRRSGPERTVTVMLPIDLQVNGHRISCYGTNSEAVLTGRIVRQ